MEFCVAVRLISLMSLVVILPSLVNLQVREPYLVDIIFKERNRKDEQTVALAYSLILFTVGIVTDTTELYTLILVWKTFIIITKPQLNERAKSLHIFFRNFSIDFGLNLVCFYDLSVCWRSTSLFCALDIQGRGLYICVLMKIYL